VSGDYQAAWFILWSSPSPDRSYIFLATKPNPTGLSLNFPRYDDPAITAALDAFRATEDRQARIDAIKEEQRSLAENMQVMFMFHRHDGFAYNTKTHGLRATTVPGTEEPAYAPYLTTPFLTAAWKS
jgi:ABC-type transport system substrate-binding protein